MTTALEGLRVLQIGDGEAAALAGMVLAENGAEVIMVEPPEGSADRGRPGHVVWNRGKRSVVLDLRTEEGRTGLARLAASADAAVVTLGRQLALRLGADDAALRVANPAIVVADVEGFEEGGPLSDLPPYEGVLAAATGRMATTNGFRPGPIFTPVPIAGYGSAMLSVLGLLAALYARRRTGRGQAVHTSLLRTLAAFDMTSGIGNRSNGPSKDGLVFGVMRVPFMTAPTKDDRFIQMCSRQKHHYRRWLTAMGLEELLEAEDLKFAPDLFPSEERIEEVVAIIRERMRERTRDEWMDVFSREDIGGDPFLSASEYLDHPQNTENDRSKDVVDPVVGHTRQIGPLGQFGDTPSVIGAPAPALGADTEAIMGSLTPRAVVGAEPAAAPRRPLEGVTVVECGYFYATPFSSTLLAEAGARIIKVEPNDGDPGRRNWTTDYVKAMVGKESIVLDLKSTEGRAIMHQLVDQADVFIHNFRPGTPARLEIDPDTLLARNPRLVYVYGSCFGTFGPWSRKAGFHSSPNAISGAGIIEAGDGNSPINRTYADPASALATAACTMIGLEARERTGRGQYIETVMLTSMAYAVSEWGVAWDGKRDRFVDRGQHGFGALHRLYETVEGWLYLEVHERREWEALCRVLGRDDLAGDERFAALARPYVASSDASAAADRELTDLLGATFATKRADDWAAALRGVGVGAVRADGLDHLHEMIFGAQQQAVGVSVEAEQEGMARFWRSGPALTWGEHDTPLDASTPLGSCTGAILTGLGYDADRIAALEASGVTRALGNELPS